MNLQGNSLIWNGFFFFFFFFLSGLLFNASVVINGTYQTNLTSLLLNIFRSNLFLEVIYLCFHKCYSENNNI